MNNQTSTKEYVNKLIEFRQAVYEHGMLRRRDVLFDLLDALVASGTVPSFVFLSQSAQFRRKWPSVEDGRLDSVWLRGYLARQVPGTGMQHFALDGSPWPRPRARTLDDRQYVYQASSDVNGGTVTVGYPYSLLEWVTQAHTSWSLPVDARRVSSAQTAQEVGAEQIRAFAQARAAWSTALDVVACDGKYGNCGFLRSVQGHSIGIVARLRCDRVLYLAAPALTGKRGRPRVHGASFAFKDSSTWPDPDEMSTLQDPLWGQVCLERWNGLHEKKGADVPYDVLRVRVHQEREKPPEALWLAWLAPVEKTLPLEGIWRAYEHRWPVEPGLHFRKETLGWTQPKFQSKEAGDRWTELTVLATWIVFLARPVVTDKPLPWQKPQPHLTPQRVQQSLASIFGLIGSPAGPPKSRGIPPGWTKGRSRARKPRLPVVRKTPAAAKPA